MKKGEHHRLGEQSAGTYVNAKFVNYTERLRTILKETYIIGYREGYIKREADYETGKPSRISKEDDAE
jgi:hypothetical protein